MAREKERERDRDRERDGDRGRERRERSQSRERDRDRRHRSRSRERRRRSRSKWVCVCVCMCVCTREMTVRITVCVCVCVWYPWFVLSYNQYGNMIVVCPSVHPSVRYRRSAETIWPQDTRSCISSSWPKEATMRQSPWVPVKALATGTITSSLNRLYKNQSTMDTYMYKPAVSLTARFMRRYFPSCRHGGSRFCILLLAYASLARETASKLMSFLDCWLVSPCAQTGCGECAC